MREIVKRDLPITREVWEHDAAVKYFENAGETYKAEWIRDGIAADEELTIYKQGDQWLDMCLGPHLPSTGKLGSAFKLIRVGGVYWRGDANTAQLPRIYGVAFATDAEVQAYWPPAEDAEQRDHRQLDHHVESVHQNEELQGTELCQPKSGQ